MNSVSQLLGKIERVQVLLANRATGQSEEGDEKEYAGLRSELLNLNLDDLPSVLRSCAKLNDISTITMSLPLPRRQDRRDFIHSQFTSVLERLRSQESDVSQGDPFERQFPAGLPFGQKKPSLAFRPGQGTQRPYFEEEQGIGILRKGVYPNLTYEKLLNNMNGTQIAERSGLTEHGMLNICQTEPERKLLERYADEYKMWSQNVPVLLPQAWVCWHSKTKSDLRSQNSSYADELYRVDFVAFWNQKRFAIVVDDISHYAKKVGSRWDADEECYSKRLKEDRRLRKEGWQVFRASNWEMRQHDFILDLLHDLRESLDF